MFTNSDLNELLNTGPVLGSETRMPRNGGWSADNIELARNILRQVLILGFEKVPDDIMNTFLEWDTRVMYFYEILWTYGLDQFAASLLKPFKRLVKSKEVNLPVHQEAIVESFKVCVNLLLPKPYG